MAEYTQQYKQVAVGTSLGDDVLVFERMTASEHVGRMFEFNVHLASEDQSIKMDDIVGQNMTIRLALPNDETRYFNGYVSRFSQGDIEGRLVRYEATLVPWLWFLTRTADCRIFQQMTVPDIIKQIFQDAGFTDVEDALSGSYRQWDYCVQYRETKFNFVSRLMEQEGIYYFFEHDNGKHTLVLADSFGAHQAFPGYRQIPYRPDNPSVDLEYINDWKVQERVIAGTYAQTDFDFEKPRKDLFSKAAISRQHANAEFEVFDYPGEFTESSDGEAYAKVRIEEMQASHKLYSANSDARGLRAGYLFELTDHMRDDQNAEYLVTESSIDLATTGYYSGGESNGEASFQCRFTAIESSEQYRTPRATPKPVVQGPQTAIVVGKSGEEIWTDKHGRVKVQFHWDRYSKADENSSCWIRVAQSWAGKKWGAIYLPRIGQEVIVEFLEGDPDRPIITGRVYNGDCMPPYKLPGNATMSTLKSLSTKGGDGFNEIRFEDKKDEEQLFIHGQKNQDVRIKNDAMEWIGNDRHLIVIANQLEEVDGDKHLTVKGDHNEKVEGTISITGDDEKHEKLSSNYALDAGSDIHIKAGSNLVIEAGSALTLKVGGNFVNISSSGVSIKGSMVNINSGGSAGSGSGASPEAAELPTEADEAEPGEAAEPPEAPQPPEPVSETSSAKVLAMAADDGTPFCEECEKAKSQQQA